MSKSDEEEAGDEIGDKIGHETVLTRKPLP